MSFVISLGVGEISVSLREALSDFLTSSLSGFGSFQILFFQILQVKIIDHKSGGNDMVLVNNFNERLNSSSFDEFLLVNSSFDVSRVSGDADNQKMWESMFLQSIKTVL